MVGRLSRPTSRQFQQRLRRLRRGLLALAVLFPAIAHSSPVTPFYTQNQSPVALIYGLPAPDNAAVVGKGHGSAMLAFDLASNFAKAMHGNETILLDGESYRVDLVLRYGIGKRIEGGIDLPYIGISSGIMDGFIQGWHDFFGFSEPDRSQAPKNRLLYSYTKNGESRLRLSHNGSGLGDIRLSTGMQLYDDQRQNPRQVALRASLKLPTGSSGALRGSGGTDFALWLSACDDYQLPTLGHLTLFGAAGGMAMTDGEVLKDQRNNWAGFGTLGLGWGPVPRIDVKTQFSGHTAFFHGTELKELGTPALQMLFGGTLHFSEETTLDIAVSEDVAVNTSPDVAFHLALRRAF